MREMIWAQEKTIFQEFRQKGSLEEHFYEFVEDKLGNSEICAQIRLISKMTN